MTSDLACLRAVGKDVAEPKPYPQEFRDDVVRVARDRGEGVTIEQVAKDFGVHPMTLHKWMRRADIDEGRSPGVTTGESAELREARKRIRLLEQENEVLRRAAATLGTWRLDGCTLVVTLEPCTMCAGALVLARVERLVFGAYDPKAGAVASLWDVVRDPRLNHRVEVIGGIAEAECGELIREFFAEHR